MDYYDIRKRAEVNKVIFWSGKTNKDGSENLQQIGRIIRNNTKYKGRNRQQAYIKCTNETMKIIATQVKGKELKPGDLFSTASQRYWDNIASNRSIGEKVYMRTEEPTPTDQAEDEIYRITIEK